jgi:hypothetical protein
MAKTIRPSPDDQGMMVGLKQQDIDPALGEGNDVEKLA